MEDKEFIDEFNSVIDKVKQGLSISNEKDHEEHDF